MTENLNNYQYSIIQSIESKLVDYAMYECKSLYNLELMYKYYLKEYSLIYRNPQEHLTKISVLAFRKTIKEYEQ